MTLTLENLSSCFLSNDLEFIEKNKEFLYSKLQKIHDDVAKNRFIRLNGDLSAIIYRDLKTGLNVHYPTFEDFSFISFECLDSFKSGFKSNDKIGIYFGNSFILNSNEGGNISKLNEISQKMILASNYVKKLSKLNNFNVSVEYLTKEDSILAGYDIESGDVLCEVLGKKFYCLEEIIFDEDKAIKSDIKQILDIHKY